MKVAVVYNRESQNVINLFGTPNREKLVLKSLQSVTQALRRGGHQVALIEGDKELIPKLEHFMPRVVKGERPGIVFNVSYGIQGHARYAHVPGILEMVGVPYVASGPLAHSLCLDKVVTKMILRQHGLPTPDFVVLTTPDMELPEIRYPMIVKPKNEAVSFGLKVVNNDEELREAAGAIYSEFKQPVLAEQFIDGREINVALLGNNPPDALPPVELQFGTGGPNIYTYEDKTHKSGREVTLACPARISDELKTEAQEIARKAFSVLGCYDCARIDMRLDEAGKLYILEVNSLPGLSERGSYATAARQVGMDYAAFINRLVEIASARYFGTPEPPTVDVGAVDTRSHVASYVTQRRDQMERELRELTDAPSRTDDPIGIQQTVQRVTEWFGELGMRPAADFTSGPDAWCWETSKGFAGGTLLVAHVDVPMEAGAPQQSFRRDPEFLHGDGVGTSRAPLIMMRYALRALRSIRRLNRLRMGVLLYSDEGRDARDSAAIIREAAGKARYVLVLRPGTTGGGIINRRRGHRKYRLQVVGEPVRPGRTEPKTQAVRWVCGKVEELSGLTSQKDQLSVSISDLNTERHSMALPHRVTATILMTYRDTKRADDALRKLRAILGTGGPKWELVQISDRPPMRERSANARLLAKLTDIAKRWDIPLKPEFSRWPSVAGLVPADTPCLCGIGPETRDRGTPQEAVQRISLVQRTLLLAEYLAADLET